ncbi:MAG: hypothetical protein CM1200mP2_54560 [Planctomycetaceae bacterium]|nr:MAG: hypothetical protein CM1200mP2_54560 [Planctomycetaceae bacterium]
MTSSANAEGKVRVAFQKGVPVPEGQLIDAQGQPTTDPSTYYADPGGAILPLGGTWIQGLRAQRDDRRIWGNAVGFGICRTDLPPGTNGVWMYLSISQRSPNWMRTRSLLRSTSLTSRRQKGSREWTRFSCREK